MWIWKLISHLEGELILQALFENVYGSHLVMKGYLECALFVGSLGMIISIAQCPKIGEVFVLSMGTG